MEGKWTKGPWSARGSYIYGNDGETVASVFGYYEANVRLIAQAPAMAEALEAHHAWSYAEHHSLGSFEARGVLCAHAESLTARALAAIRGGAAPDYKGRRSLTVWPVVEIIESDEASARALVAEVLEHERAALSPYTPAAPEMPADCHPQEG